MTVEQAATIERFLTANDQLASDLARFAALPYATLIIKQHNGRVTHGELTEHRDYSNRREGDLHLAR